MKTVFSVQCSEFRVLGLLAVISTIGIRQSALGQGSLTPPGPPAPTFKTLTEIEPRIVVNATNTPGDASNLFIISQPGSYYLTTNIVGVAGKNGIAIRSSGVRLDLGGFALFGVATANAGIRVQGSHTNVCVRDGTISGWGQVGGVIGGTAVNSQFENLRISHNATVTGDGQGLGAGDGCLVVGCTVSFNGELGIAVGEGSQVRECTAAENGGDGIAAFTGSTVTDCVAITNGAGGISTQDGCTVQNCVAAGNRLGGIGANQRCTIRSCTVSSNQLEGISVDQTAVVADCLVESNAGPGIQAGAGSAIQGCTARANTGDGISVGDGSTVAGCSASGNTTNGIVATVGCAIRDCTVRSNSLDGIQVGSNCQVLNNLGVGNGNGTTNTAGIHATGNGNRIDGNHAFANNGDGIRVDATGTKNFVVRNTSGGNTVFQFRVPGIIGQPPDGANVIGPIFTDATNVNANAWANFGL